MITDQQKLESNIWKLYLYEILYSLMFFTPIIVLFYQKNGLSFAQIMTIQSINSVLWILLEIPTGYFADVVGRKQSLAMTGIFATLSMLTYGLGTNFYHFLIASLFWALAGVFISGADSALIYDSLKELNKESLYKKVMGNIVFCYSIGASVASIVGGWLGGINFRYSFFVMLPFYILLIPLSFSFHEPKKNREIITNKKHFDNLFETVKITLFQNNRIRQLILYSAIIISILDISYYLYQPYFELSGLDIVYFGLVFAAFNIIRAFSAKYAHLIEERIGESFSLIILFVLTSLCYLLMAKVIFILSFIFAFIFQFVSGFSGVVISDYVNREIDSNIRATVLSAMSLVDRVFYAVMAPIVGWLVDIYTLSQAFMIIGVVVAIVGVVLVLPLLKRNISKIV